MLWKTWLCNGLCTNIGKLVETFGMPDHPWRVKVNDQVNLLLTFTPSATVFFVRPKKSSAVPQAADKVKEIRFDLLWHSSNYLDPGGGTFLWLDYCYLIFYLDDVKSRGVFVAKLVNSYLFKIIFFFFFFPPPQLACRRTCRTCILLYYQTWINISNHITGMGQIKSIFCTACALEF